MLAKNNRCFINWPQSVFQRGLYWFSGVNMISKKISKNLMVGALALCSFSGSGFAVGDESFLWRIPTKFSAPNQIDYESVKLDKEKKEGKSIIGVNKIGEVLSSFEIHFARLGGASDEVYDFILAGTKNKMDPSEDDRKLASLIFNMSKVHTAFKEQEIQKNENKIKEILKSTHNSVNLDQVENATQDDSTTIDDLESQNEVLRNQIKTLRLLEIHAARIMTVFAKKLADAEQNRTQTLNQNTVNSQIQELQQKNTDLENRIVLLEKENSTLKDKTDPNYGTLEVVVDSLKTEGREGQIQTEDEDETKPLVNRSNQAKESAGLLGWMRWLFCCCFPWLR